MPYKKAANLRSGDLICYPVDGKVWSEVYEVDIDNRGNIYVAIEGFGHVSWNPNKEVEVKD